jgi:glucose-6-phosphate 1-dehydrogenase
VRGQYRAGSVEGKAVPGYLEEVKVPPAACETFVALRTEVQNWRWAGVPFYLRTGKRLAERDAQIVVNFRPVPHKIFPGATSRTSWSSSCSRRTAWSCNCWRQGRGQRRER